MNTMTTLKLGLAALLPVCLSACGTTYKPPAEPAPMEWQGAHGFVVTGTEWAVEPGRHELRSAFARLDMKNRRTARLRRPVSYTSGPGITSVNKEATLVAGTPLYARQYTQTRMPSYNTLYDTTGRAGRQQRDLDPIEWCTARPNGPGAVCIFWEGEDQAFYAEDERGSPLSPTFGSAGSLTNTPVGSRSTAPSIELADDVEFGDQLQMALVPVSIRKKDVMLHQIVGSEVDGEFRGVVTAFRRHTWDDNGMATVKMAGGEFRVSAVRSNPDERPTAVNIEVVSPPKVPTVPQLSPEDLATLLKLMMEGREVEQGAKP